MAISKFTPLNAKKDTGRTIGDNEVAKLANLNRMVDQVNAALAGGGGGGLGTLDIITEGVLGYNPSIQYSLNAYPSGTTSGAQSSEVVSVPSIGFYSQGYGSGSNSLTSITFPTLKYASYFSIGSYTSLNTVSAPELLQADGIQLTGLSSLQTANFPKLISCTSSGITFYASNPFTIVNLNFQSLVSARLSINGPYCGIPSISSSKFPALTSISMQGGSANDLVSVDLPGVTELSNSGFSYNAYNSTFTTLNVPNIVTIKNYYLSWNSNPGLTNVTLGTAGILKKFDTNGSNPYINFQSCALNQTSVDNMLITLASLDGTNGTTASYSGQLYLNGGSNASPSGAGQNARNILQSRGWYVATN